MSCVQLISPLPAACQSHEGYAWSLGLLPKGIRLGKKLNVAGTPARNLGVLTKIRSQPISIPVNTMFSGRYLSRKSRSCGNAKSSSDHCAIVSSFLVLPHNSGRTVAKSTMYLKKLSNQGKVTVKTVLK
jgi:hypothetical protein